MRAEHALFDGTDVFFYELTDSTNNRAKEYADGPCGTEAFLVAKSQTSGRGRRGRSFESDEGGIYLSYLLFPDIPASEAIKLTVFAAVAVAEAIKEVSALEPKIKWVNDVFLGGKKVAGILTEGEFSSDGGFRYAVVGIGINVKRRDFLGELREIATDIETECGKEIDREELLSVLMRKLLSFDPSLMGEYMRKYRKMSLAVGKRVLVRRASEEYFATVLGIAEDGSLEVELDGGEKRNLISGEISIRL